MPTKSDAIRAELRELIQTGDMLHIREIVRTATPVDRESLAKAYETRPANPGRPAATKKPRQATPKADQAPPRASNEPDTLDEFARQLAEPVNFKREYQSWYSKALRIVEQLLPDRYQEFVELYRVPRRKSIDVETYSIYDYLAGITVTRSFGTELVFNNVSVAMQKFDQQLNILRSVSGRLDSLLTDLMRVLQASLIDDELEAARQLHRAKHLRSAGVLAGVTLESHLKQLLRDHRVSMRKTATLSNLNEALKSADIYGVPEWRQIQYLTDLRNICAHKAEREPESDEIDRMISAVDALIHTLF